MTKLSKDAVASLIGIQSEPFGMVPEKTANELINAGFASLASVELNEADTLANKGNLPLQCTLEGLSYGKTDDKTDDAITVTGNDEK
jgi:hypothetical protein